MMAAVDCGSAVDLACDAFGRLVLTDSVGRVHRGVVPVRSFPFTAPQEWVSLCDEHGHEVCSIPQLDRLPAEIRELLEAELARREFIPVIRRISSVSSGAEPTEWHVVTDRGETRFLLTSEDHIRRLGPKAALITDANGIRYRITDIAALDHHSRRILRRYL